MGNTGLAGCGARYSDGDGAVTHPASAIAAAADAARDFRLDMGVSVLMP